MLIKFANNMILPIRARHTVCFCYNLGLLCPQTISPFLVNDQMYFQQMSHFCIYIAGIHQNRQLRLIVALGA